MRPTARLTPEPRCEVRAGRETFACHVYDGGRSSIHSEGAYLMGDKGLGSKGGGKKPKTSTKKSKGAAGK